jgi:hypothetical protein
MVDLLQEAEIATEIGPEQTPSRTDRWLIFQYAPVALFSLKMSRATSTMGKTLLVPSPYSVKMAFLDAALRHGLTENPEDLVRGLARANLRIGVPDEACVTITIQSIRQETRDEDRKRQPDLPPYRGNIAMREFVHHTGVLRLAFELRSLAPDLAALLIGAAPAINYLGKRGSFLQYLGCSRERAADNRFTQPVKDMNPRAAASGQSVQLDDFGPRATFAALNSFSPAKIERGVHRTFVDTLVPLVLYNSGPGFMHYRAAK